MKLKYFLALAIYITACSNGFAYGEDCDQGVDFNNGNTTKGKSGAIVCHDRDTHKISRTVTLKNGETVKEAQYKNGIKLWEENRKNGKKEGLVQRFYDSGKLKESGDYNNDSPIGTETSYFENGKISALNYYVKDKSQPAAQVTFNETGNPTFTACDKGYPTEFNKYCNGKVQLYSDSNSKTKTYAGDDVTGVVKSENGIGGVDNETTYSNGKKDGPAKFYDEKGKLTRVENFIHGKKAGPQTLYFKDSDQVMEILTIDDQGEKEIKYQEYYQNGSPKSLKEDLGNWKYSEKGYYDNGNLCCEYVYQEDLNCDAYDWFCGGKFVGDAKHYDKEGWLKEVDSYDDKGNLAKSITYESKNASAVTKYYYPDGSEKRN